MKKSKVIQALTAQANADKAKAMMALELLTDADDRLETLNKYWGEQPLPF
jgi:hypothetical protein